jgi:hypothetical protein
MAPPISLLANLESEVSLDVIPQHAGDIHSIFNIRNHLTSFILPISDRL